MKFKLDENLPAEAAEVLQASGFEAHAVWDESLSGAADEAIAIRARDEGRILVTLDLDFADIRTYPPGEHTGIIVLRPKNQDKVNVVAHVRRLMMALAHRDPVGELWIVPQDRIRYRADTPP